MVHKALDKTTNSNVAVKVYEKKNLAHREKKQFVQSEIDVLSSIDHPNIGKFYRVIEDVFKVYIIQERCGNQSLSDYVKKSNKAHRLDEPEAKIIFKEFVSGLSHLHSKNICHRDLKLTNVLIEKIINQNHAPSYKVKLIDFGFSIHSTRKYRTYCGTPSYMAPELVSRNSYDGIKVDLWATGVI